MTAKEYDCINNAIDGEEKLTKLAQTNKKHFCGRKYIAGRQIVKKKKKKSYMQIGNSITRIIKITIFSNFSSPFAANLIC